MGNFNFDEEDELDLASYLTEQKEDTEPAPVTAKPPLRLVDDLPLQPKLRLDDLELPNGFKIDPEDLGIDLSYLPEGAGPSTFATDLEEEVVAEFKEFMETPEAQSMTEAQLQAALLAAIDQKVAQFKERWNTSAAIAMVKPKDQHSAIVRGTIGCALLLLVLLFSVKTAVVLLLMAGLGLAGLYFWKRYEDENPENTVTVTLARIRKAMTAPAPAPKAVLPPAPTFPPPSDRKDG